jgi:hypothetical protein
MQRRILMRTIHYALGAILGVSLLAGCGGGGGGSGSGSSGGSGGSGSPTAVVITESSATAVGSHALENVQTTSAAEGGGGLLTGVQVQTAGGGSPTYAASVRALTKLVKPQPSVATGVAFSETVPCDISGKVDYSGNISGQDGLVAGDTITMAASNCQMNVEGTAATMNGSFSITVVSGSIGDTLPFHVVLATTATDFSVSAGGETVVSNGDMTLDWTATTATAETLVATGSRFSNRLSSSGTTFTSTWTNYTQSLAYDGSTITGSLSGTIETTSAKLGSSGATYQISTPTALVWDSATGAVTAGSIRVVGASNAQLLITVTATDTFRLQVDANGDGSNEATLTVTAAQLQAAL